MPIPSDMSAMVLEAPGSPMRPMMVRIPAPGRHEVLVQVQACAVCRTDLHVVDGELTRPKLPLIPGHQIVGRIMAVGPEVKDLRPGEPVGIPWLGRTCGTCAYCTEGRENLCDLAEFTGYTLDGGFAEFVLAHEGFCLRIPAGADAVKVAPLLCAGLIGYRSYRMTGDRAHRLGIYGFGAAAHIIAQVAVHQGRRVFAFTSPGDLAAQEFARSLGAAWAGDSTSTSPEGLDAAIIFAPVGALVPAALRAVVKGGTVVCGGIHMSDIPAFPYEILWGERSLRSVANLTRRDGQEFLELVARIQIHTTVVTYPLAAANQALSDLRSGNLQGAAVLVTGDLDPHS